MEPAKSLHRYIGSSHRIASREEANVQGRSHIEVALSLLTCSVLSGCSGAYELSLFLPDLDLLCAGVFSCWSRSRGPIRALAFAVGVPRRRARFAHRIMVFSRAKHGCSSSDCSQTTRSNGTHSTRRISLSFARSRYAARSLARSRSDQRSR